MDKDEGEPEEADPEELELEDLEDLDEIQLVGEVRAKRDEAAGGTDEARPARAPEPSGPVQVSDHAAKVYSMELISGEFVRASGSARSFLRLWNGENIDKARVMGTIAHKFSSNDGTYSALTLDDGTETIRVKGWREETKAMQPFETGQIVDVIGHIREYEGEIYLSPLSVCGISDPNWEPLRELEIYRLRKVKKNDLQL